MKNYLQDNMLIIQKRFPGLYTLLTDAPDDGSIVVLEAKNGESVPIFTKDEKKQYIHSRFDPRKEAERFCEGIDARGQDLVVVFGFGFAYHLEPLLTKMRKDALLLVIEKNPLLIRKACEYREMTALLKDSRVIILIDPDDNTISDTLKGKASKQSSLVTHRGSFQTDMEYYGNARERVRSYLSTKDVNIATLAKFEKVWSANLARNIMRFVDSPGVSIFYNGFKKIPAIIAAAGPSLIEGLDFIRQNKNRALIIAVDTSYHILLENGITPHFCLAVDPQLINARYFEGVPETETILIADPTLHPSAFRLFRGQVAVTGIAFNLLKWIEDITGEKGEMTHGGSVSTNAYDFARRCGAAPIILVGQDLAFTGGYAHARGAYLDELVHIRTGRFFTPEMHNRFQLTALPKISIPGIRSKRVATNQKMMIFISWFEKQGSDALINATADGARIPGIAHTPPSAISLKELKKDIPGIIESIFGTRREVRLQDICERLLKKIDIISREIDSLIPVLSRAAGDSEGLLVLIRKNRRDRGKMDYILKRLAEADRAVESKKNARDIISFAVQKTIHTITEGFDIDEEDRTLSSEELTAKRSIYVYTGLLEGARFNSRVLTSMSKLLKRIS